MDGWKPQPGPRSGPQTLSQAARQTVASYRQTAHEDSGREDEDRKLISIREFAAQSKSTQGQQAVKIAQDWERMLPAGSKWQPGMPGRYDCAICFGLGFVSVDLPLGHPKQGKLFACDCRSGADYKRLSFKSEDDGR